MNSLNRLLLCLLAVILALIPLAMAFTRGTVDPYLEGIVSSSILYESASHIPIESAQFINVPGLGLLLIALAKVGGLDPELSMYLPIGGALLFFSGFILARHFTRSTPLALAIALAIAFRWLPPTLSTVWPHTFGFALYFMFAAIYFKIGTARQPVHVLLLWVLYLGIHMFSYTAELWVIAFVGAVTILRFLRREPVNSMTSSLPLAIIVTFFGFTQIVYSGYIPRVETGASGFGVGIEALLSSVFRTTPPIPHGWVPPHTPLLILVIQVAWYLVVFSPLFIVVAERIVNYQESRELRGLLASSTALLGFVLVWPVDAAAYALLGAFPVGVFRYSTLSGLLLSVPLTEVHGARRGARSGGAVLFAKPQLFAIILVTTSIILFASASTQTLDVSSVSKYTNTEAGASWLFTHEPSVRQIYSDHMTEGQFAIEAARLGFGFETGNLYNVTTYQQLIGVGLSPTNRSYFEGQFIVVNIELAQFKTTSAEWIDFEPLGPHLAQIKANPTLSLIYDDGSMWIMRGSN